ncbi:hypothetical protein Mycch_3975 [Mycolicibacterium chubuense NBB4]|uniref:DUF5302 domain-containing protein n=1 Tax=Mycolicibacterium chubuense (strain NBB4) TaxID=710421 RepID=I4BN42_MYCCN|nr:DUF5302 domain-containing protein [Mycolicibacterium chubuense]AFM18699.1 hypothetical protein Mycch_3975 [Mycolicibacterium chubuense NBB4]
MASDGSAESSKSSGGPEGSEDETKRRFREALERKKAKSAGGSAHRDAGSKQPRAHGPLENRREFRRKSG